MTLQLEAKDEKDSFREGVEERPVERTLYAGWMYGSGQGWTQG